MTVGAAVRTARELIFVFDSREGTYVPVGKLGQLTGQKPTMEYQVAKKLKIVAAGGNKVIVAYAGDFDRDSLRSLFNDLERELSTASFDSIVERLAEVSRRLSVEAIRSSPKKPPIQFLVGAAQNRRLRLARIDTGDHVEPEPYATISIGGADPWTSSPLPEETNLNITSRGPKAALVSLVRGYIEATPADIFGLPLYWLTATVNFRTRDGWFPKSH